MCSKKVDMNNAGIDEWMSLSGVGRSTAENILKQKEKLGIFKDINDLLEVPRLNKNFIKKHKKLLFCEASKKFPFTPHRELRSASRQSLKRKLPNEERQIAKKVTRHKPQPNQASETTRKQIKTNKTPNDVKLDLFSVNNPQKNDEDTTDDHLVSSSSQTRLSMSLRSKQSPNNLKKSRTEEQSKSNNVRAFIVSSQNDECDEDMVISSTESSRNIFNQEQLDQWLRVFMSWPGTMRLQALDGLMNVCVSSEVRHVMQVIEPQFQRDFISLLPKELALYVLSFLEAKDLLSAAQTCSYWHTLAEDNLLWKEKCHEEDITESLVYPGNTGRGRKIQNHHHHTSVRGATGSTYKCLYLRQKQIENNWKTAYRAPKYLKGHDDHVITCLEFSGSKIVSGSDDNTLKVWSATTGRCLRTLWGHTGGVWSSQMSGSLIISGSTDRTLRVWNADTGVCKHTLSGHTSTVRCMHLHNKRVVSGSRDATLRVWDVETGECLHILIGHVAAVRCVQYDGVKVVSGGYDYMVKIWDPESETCLQNLSGHTNRVYSLQFDGSHIVSGSLDTSIRVWNVETGVCVQTLIGHQSLTSGMELRNNILVSGNADSTVKVWNISTGQCLQTLHGPNKHLSAVTCLQFNGNLIITSSDDGTVKLWDLRTGEFIRNLVALESGGSGGVVWRIRCSNTKLVCAVGSRNGTEDTKLLVIDFGVTDDDSDRNTPITQNTTSITSICRSTL